MVKVVVDLPEVKVTAVVKVGALTAVEGPVYVIVLAPVYVVTLL